MSLNLLQARKEPDTHPGAEVASLIRNLEVVDLQYSDLGSKFWWGETLLCKHSYNHSCKKGEVSPLAQLLSLSPYTYFEPLRQQKACHFVHWANQFCTLTALKLVPWVHEADEEYAKDVVAKCYAANAFAALKAKKAEVDVRVKKDWEKGPEEERGYTVRMDMERWGEGEDPGFGF